MGQGVADGFEGAQVVAASGGESSHQAAGEGIACACRVNDPFGWVRGQGADAVAVDEDAAVFAFFDDDESWAQFEEVPSGGDWIAVSGVLLGFVEVEDQAIDLAQKVGQFGLGDGDPEIHRVDDGEFQFTELFEHAELDHWVGVGQEQNL